MELRASRERLARLSYFSTSIDLSTGLNIPTQLI